MKYGFEVEGFYRSLDTNICIPPSNYPVDGFGGLVEFRSCGPCDLEKAYLSIIQGMMKYKNVDVLTHEHTFTPKQKAAINARYFEKGGYSVQNIYGKSPKALGNKTLASFQINFSQEGTISVKDEKGNYDVRKYSGLFDFVPIIRGLDEEFADEIKEAKRQPGVYCIKDSNRVEYRSLPNFVFDPSLEGGADLLRRIQSVVEGV